MRKKRYVLKPGERQLLDYYVSKELKDGSPVHGYARRVQKNLADSHAIHLGATNVYQRVERVFAGDRLRPSADVDGTPSSREGKDQNYAGFLSLVDVFIPNRYERAYIGLPANQLDVIASQIGGPVLAVERDPERAQGLEQLNKLVEQRRTHKEGAVQIICDDIFNVMKGWKGHNLNVIDLDLMCALPEQSLPWVKAISNCAARGKVVVNLTTTLGRSLSKANYENHLFRFNFNLASAGFITVGNSSFSYRDRVFPMRCERYVLERSQQ